MCIVIIIKVRLASLAAQLSGPFAEPCPRLGGPAGGGHALLQPAPPGESRQVIGTGQTGA